MMEPTLVVSATAPQVLTLQWDERYHAPMRVVSAVEH
jgi:hypothetical protein